MSLSIPLIAPAPIASSERLEVLDALRGLAILGILLLNISGFSGIEFMSPAQKASVWGAEYEQPARVFVNWFVHGKFYALFSFLFGVGFAVFLQRTGSRDGGSARLLKRRLLGLLLIGLVHSILIWFGDILVLYAMFGFLLLAFRNRSDRTLLRWVVALLLCPIVIYGAGAIAVAAMGTTPGSGANSGMGALPPFLVYAIQQFDAGGYRQIVEGNLLFTAAGWVRRIILFMLPRIFGMFLLGYLLGRRGFFRDLEAQKPLLHHVFRVGLGVGLPASAGYAWLMERAIYLPPTPLGWVMTTLESIGTPLLSLGYTAGITLLWLRPGSQRVLAWLAPVGRMALTNYLLQSLVCVAIFYGIGFDLWMRVGLAPALGISLAIFAVQIVLSRFWLAQFAFGPVEWLWRQFTYGKRVALRNQG